MNFEEMSGRELLKYYIDYLIDFELDPNAPEEAKKAYAIAEKRGEKTKELRKKGIILEHV